MSYVCCSPPANCLRCATGGNAIFCSWLTAGQKTAITIPRILSPSNPCPSTPWPRTRTQGPSIFLMMPPTSPIARNTTRGPLFASCGRSFQVTQNDTPLAAALVGHSVPLSTHQYGIRGRTALANHLLHGQRAAAPCAGRGADGGAAVPAAAVSHGGRVFSGRLSGGNLSGDCGQHYTASVGTLCARCRCRDRACGLHSVCPAPGTPISDCFSGLVGNPSAVAGHRSALSQNGSRSGRQNTQHPRCACLDGR